MVAVKGSKQFEMVVVPYRPGYRALLTLVVLLLGVAASGVAYFYGRDEGLELKVEAVRERDELRHELNESGELIAELRQKLADLRLGDEVDTRANEEVRQTVEQLQTSIAQLEEEIRFYKGVMVPDAENKGLRIERFDVVPSGSGKMRYRLLLTQVVDKHEYVQGTVEINLIGSLNGVVRSESFSSMETESGNTIRFRFRYFQNIDGEVTLPEDFQPSEVIVSARAAGRNGEAVERRFDWQPSRG